MHNRFQKPYPMSRISYPTPAAELETWVEQTIQREITRGRMLQDQKSLASEPSNKVSVFVPKLANGRSISIRNKRGNARSKSPLRKNARMSSSVSRDDSCSSYRSPRLVRPACSMRISELAAPTKRQCMASWRANANILPETMINRLKDRVTDQEPIVKVSDAINCLKHKRRLSDSSNSVVITSSKRPSRKINKEVMNEKIQAEYKVLSEAFGIKMAELLMKPIAVSLNSQLKNLSNIISDEIYNIIKDTKTFKTDKATNKLMVQEISEKVTIWVAKILDESSEKLLEEELKARASPAGDVQTLIEIITYKEKDLDEQEGPVLDVLDDLVDSILHKCIKTPSDILTPEYLSFSSEDADQNEQQKTDDQTLNEEPIEDTIENDILNQLNNVIASVTQDSLESPSKEANDRLINNEGNYEILSKKSESIIQPEVNIEPELDIKIQSDLKPKLNNEPELVVESEADIKHDIDVLYSNDTPLAMPEDDNDDEYIENISGSGTIELGSTRLSTIEIVDPSINQNKANEKTELETLLAPEENNVTDTNEEQTSNVSGAIELINEELPEGKNNTVQFSNKNLDPIKRAHIDFAPPNDELLSDADESWPETVTITKPSASVTRSITSMGRILESDEGVSIAFDEATEYLLQATDSRKQFEVVGDDNDLDDENNHTRSITSKVSTAFDDATEYLLQATDSRTQFEVAGDDNDLDNKNNHTRSITSIVSTAFDDATEYLLEAPDSKKRLEVEDDIDLDDEKNQLSTVYTVEATGGLKENNLEKTGDMQSSKGLPGTDNIAGEKLQGLLTKPDNPSGMISSLQLLQESSFTLLKSDESIILIGDEHLLDSKLYQHTIWASDFSKSRSQSPERFANDITDDNKNETLTAEKISLHKFDYRVDLETAPAWIRRGQGEPNGMTCACKPFNFLGSINKLQERELGIRKWCQDLDFVLMNLNKWKTWLNYISKYINDLKRKAGKVNGSRYRSPQRTEEAHGRDSWRQLQKRATCGLEMRRKEDTVKLKIPSVPLKYCLNCGRRNPNQSKRRHHQGNIRNNIESKCKRHHKRET